MSLIERLQSYDMYKNMNESAIRKSIGKIYGIDRARNVELAIELDELKNNKTYIIEDMQFEILLKLKYPDIVMHCATNKTYKKVCDNNKFWQLMIARDYPFLADDTLEAKKIYKSFFEFFDKWTTEIMAEFITFKTKYLNMQDVYGKINKTLIQFHTENSNIDLDEDEQNNYLLQNTLKLNTLYTLFDILSIPVAKGITSKQIKPPSDMYRVTDIDKFKYMSFIFYNMVDEFIDL